MEMEFQLSGVSHREESPGGLCGGCLILIRGDSLATTSDAAFSSSNCNILLSLFGSFIECSF